LGKILEHTYIFIINLKIFEFLEFYIMHYWEKDDVVKLFG
jgi:hypothetical protein